MKCEVCEGKGFKELEHGLVMVDCEECEGTGEIAIVYQSEPIGTNVITDEGLNLIAKVLSNDSDSGAESSYTGLLFQLTGKRTDEYSIVELWMMAKEASLEKIDFPYSLTMPCRNTARFDSPSSILDLIPVNILCACGNPNHYIVRFIDEREECESDSGARPANQPAGGKDTSKPKQPKKRKAKKRAAKGTR